MPTPTAAATADLVERAGGVVVGLAFLLELTFLAGRERLAGRHVDLKPDPSGVSAFLQPGAVGLAGGVDHLDRVC